MRDGFIKVAAATSQLKVGDVAYNVEQICRQIAEADGKGAKVIVFPELAITGYTCGDLFFQQTLLQAAEEGLTAISRFTAGAGSDAVVFVGLPMEMDGKLYNVAACIQSGKILGLITKKNIPNYDEYQELRYFTPGNEMPVPVMIGDDIVPFGMNIVIDATSSVPGLMIGCEICEDAWVRETPSTALAAVGVTLMVNLSASAEYISKARSQRELVAATSKRLTAGYVYASAGPSESTSDMIFSGHRLIYENGHKLAEGELFTEGLTISEIDVERLVGKRRKMNTYTCIACAEDMYHRAIISFDEAETILTRPVAPLPFVPGGYSFNREKGKNVIPEQIQFVRSGSVEQQKKNPEQLTEQDQLQCANASQQMEHVLMMQALGLKKRMEHIGAKKAVIGISGGLDSTLALVATCKAYSMMGRDASDIIGITMPCFGTSNRTYKNACELIKKLGCTFREINIKEAVTLHLKDIGHDMDTHDAAFENAQARERTQILMDVANSENGIVIGTGDLSELALGWCTYNGDQMSMYGLNAGVPKTLIRTMISYLAEKKEYADVADNLRDVVATPVSPELLPLKDGEIGQKTEDIVGPYELHDFFLYHMIHDGFTPKKIYRLACIAFAEGDITFDSETIKKWMKVFYRRFVIQQYKRAAMPDGMRITNVSLSPRSTFRMPSDACATLWLDEVDRL